MRVVWIVVVLAAVALSATPAPSESKTSPYRVGPEDVVGISVARHPEFSGDYRIPDDGVVELPGVGRTSLAGMTLAEISDKVKETLSSRLNDPEVSVVLKAPRMQRVYVLGVVQKPGLYDLKPGWRVTEALAAAGGLSEQATAKECKGSILRAATGERADVDVAGALAGVAEANELLSSGDVLMVDAEETLPVYVMGRVKNPGICRIKASSAKVMEAIALAGGALDDAALTRVTITHVDGATNTIDLSPAIVDGADPPRVEIKAGDLIIIPEETARVAVLGSVREPGFHPLRNGKPMTLSDVLSLSKGIDKRGEMGAVAIIRTQHGQQQQLVYDLSKFLRSGDATQNPLVQPGDVVYVAQSRRPDWESIFRSLGAVALIANPFVP